MKKIALVLVFLAWVVVVGACLPVQRDNRQIVTNKMVKKRAESMISTNNALTVAKQKAVEMNYKIDEYTSHVEHNSKYWIFHFKKKHSKTRGGEQHFSIWITKDTEEFYRLFKGR